VSVLTILVFFQTLLHCTLRAEKPTAIYLCNMPQDNRRQAQTHHRTRSTTKVSVLTIPLFFQASRVRMVVQYIWISHRIQNIRLGSFIIIFIYAVFHTFLYTTDLTYSNLVSSFRPFHYTLYYMALFASSNFEYLIFSFS
jgi:K+-sensing histidine kinase KdpD